MNRKHTAIVLGMFETGLGVGRSLGRNGIKVFGLDFKKDIAFYSKYIEAKLCPHPLNNESQFIDFLISFAKNLSAKPVLFLTSDDFLISISRNRETLHKYFLINLPNRTIIESIIDKYQQYQLALTAGIEVPITYSLEKSEDVTMIKDKINYPAFIKAKEVTTWRCSINGTTKGFVVNNSNDFVERSKLIFEKGVHAVVQEIIEGPDTNHYKFCAYVSSKGEFLLGFTLRKIRQNPIHFGVGSVVESVEYPELMEIGRKFFSTINYRGVGSAEFKVDERDDELKLIELNPRYWQQNYLATVCGMNFPLVDYLEVTGQNPKPIHNFKIGIKWVNRYMDFDSFLSYNKEGSLNFREWRKSLRGKKVYSDFVWSDPIPALYEIGFGYKLFKAPLFVLRRI